MIMLLTLSTGVWARPNFGLLTDGRFKFTVKADDDLQYVLLESFAADTILYIGLRSTAGGYVVDSLYADRMPEPYQAGDTAVWNDRGMMFFRQQRPYASMKPLAEDDDPRQLRRHDMLRMVWGQWTYGSSGTMCFGENADGTPFLQPARGQPEEALEFLPAVVRNGRSLIHIKTAHRQWLLQLTAGGMNVYQALYNSRNKTYQCGKLLRRAKGFAAMDIGGEGLPFVDLLSDYLENDQFIRLINQ